MTIHQAINEVVKCSGKGIRRPCWQDKTLRITGDKQFAGSRVVPKGMETEVMNEISKDIQTKQESIYDGSDLFYQTDKLGYSEGGVYNNMPFKIEFAGEGLPNKRIDYMAKDWEIYRPDN